MTKRPHLWGQRLEDLMTFFQAHGLEESKSRYHSKQIFRWIYQRHIYNVDLMTDLSKTVRALIKEKFDCEFPLNQVVEKKSEDGTKKYLFKLYDGETIESVLIPVFAGEQDPDDLSSDNQSMKRLTICISSQVGCAMGCKFCLTGTQGLKRNLEVQEIVGQVLLLSQNNKISNIVFMGMGEPLHNLENVARALEILLSQDGLNFSKRKVTVSTSGLVPQIKKFNERMKLPFRPNLAISLNGSDNNNRNLVMPVNKAYPIESLMEALKEYKLESFRKITFEYVILDGINDTIEDAKKVLNLVREVPSKVNIIPFNPHHGSEFKRPDDSKVEAFQKFLEKNGVYSTIRYSRGRDILAACGQLKSAQENLAQKNLALKNSMKENLVQ